MTALLRSWASALGGEICGRDVLCPGPGHSARDRSLSVTVSAAAPDGFVAHSFAADDALACKDYVRRRLGLPEFRPQDRRLAPQSITSRNPKKPERVAKQLTVELPNGTQDLAGALWRAARDPRGTLVEQYLKSRRLELPSAAANEVIRFHPECRFGRETFPAMICLLRAVGTDAPQGIQRTALARDGTAIKRGGKTYRLSLGKMSGGVVKVDADQTVERGICIAEGVETALAGRRIGYRPVWATAGVGGIARFEVLRGVDGLTIFGERDERRQNEIAIRACAERWLAAERDVLTIWPLSGCDLNDEIRGRHDREV